ncbi:MAG: 4Fe-4S binding protein, partial [Clostridiales bacterium]|nr:4Fe-4S binding protein [Clostridiales bacterium]
YHPSGISDQSKCIACGNCAKICPDSVITVERLDKE